MEIIDQTYLTSVGGPVMPSGSLAALSEEVQEYLGHKLDAADYVQWLNGTGQPYIRIDEWPLLRIYFAACGADQSLQIEFAGTGPASVQSTSTGVTLRASGSDTTVTYADQATLSALAAALTTGDWTVTVCAGVEGTLPSEYLRPGSCSLGQEAPYATGYLYGPGRALDLVPDPETDRDLLVAGAPADDLWPGEAVGTQRGYGSVSPGSIPHGTQNVMLHFRAGYEGNAYPPALKSVVARIARGYDTAMRTSAQMQSEKIGDYSYSRGNAMAIIEQFAADLQPWRNIDV